MQLIHCLLVALLSVTNLSVQGLSIQSPDHRSQVQVIQAYLEDVQPQVTSSSEYSKDQREESSLTNESNLSDEDELPFPTDGSQQLSSHQVHMHLKVTKKKNLTLTCPELNNVTFTNAPPFDVLGIPDGCGSTVQPQVMLYLPPIKDVNNGTAYSCKLEPQNMPNNQTTPCLKSLSERKDVKKFVILIHGFLNSFATQWLHDMQADLQAVDPGTAVMIVGWGRGLEDIFSYWRAAGNTRYMAHALYLLMVEVHAVMPRKIFYHCAGHSLGGQICGLTGKQLIAKDESKMKFDRISGMDPAGPLFYEDVPYPFNYDFINGSARLGHTDAHFVDVIHTDGDARYLEYIPQYGTMMRVGTVDFYPGSGDYYGCYQPGCGDIIDVVSCSHSRAHYFYASSLKQAVCLADKVCHGNPHKIPKTCVSLRNTTEHNNINMGYWVLPSTKGMYTVEVTAKEPYCAPPEKHHS